MAGTISSLQQQKNNSERVSVFIDGEFAFGVTLDTAVRLAKGQFLSDADIAALQTDDEHDRAYQSALHYLGSRPRSSVEVQRNLQEKGFGEEAIVGGDRPPGRASLPGRRGVCRVTGWTTAAASARGAPRPFVTSCARKASTAMRSTPHWKAWTKRTPRGMRRRASLTAGAICPKMSLRTSFPVFSPAAALAMLRCGARCSEPGKLSKNPSRPTQPVPRSTRPNVLPTHGKRVA